MLSYNKSLFQLKFTARKDRAWNIPLRKIYREFCIKCDVASGNGRFNYRGLSKTIHLFYICRFERNQSIRLGQSNLKQIYRHREGWFSINKPLWTTWQPHKRFEYSFDAWLCKMFKFFWIKNSRSGVSLIFFHSQLNAETFLPLFI